MEFLNETILVFNIFYLEPPAFLSKKSLDTAPHKLFIDSNFRIKEREGRGSETMNKTSFRKY